jgi:hypothetical protein
MSRFNTFLVAAFVSAAMLFPRTVRAMDIIQFDQMAARDRQDFLDTLPTVAQTVLEQAGRSADAQKAQHLFNDISPGSKLPLGEAELEMNLDNARVRDAEKHIKNLETPRVQVEVALAETLQKNGIEVTPDLIKSLMQQTGTFKPTDPPGGDLNVQRADDLEKAKALLAKGGDVNAKDNGGETPLHDAAAFNCKGVAAVLLVSGADVNAKDNPGDTPLVVAVQKHSDAVADLLRAPPAPASAVPAPAPSVTKAPSDDDDPIGGGGFI